MSEMSVSCLITAIPYITGALPCLVSASPHLTEAIPNAYLIVWATSVVMEVPHNKTAPTFQN